GLVIHARDSGGRCAVELAHEEALRVHCGEAGGVGKAGVPAFRRRPVDRDGDFVRPHGPDAQVSHASFPLAATAVRKKPAIKAHGKYAISFICRRKSRVQWWKPFEYRIRMQIRSAVGASEGPVDTLNEVLSVKWLGEKADGAARECPLLN